MLTSCWDVTISVTQPTREVNRLGSTVARLKLKGIDGDPHKRWMMWINSMQREKPYLPLTCQEALVMRACPQGSLNTGAAWLSSARVVRCWVKSRLPPNFLTTSIISSYSSCIFRLLLLLLSYAGFPDKLLLFPRILPRSSPV